MAAAKLSARYISGRLLPDKAVDLLDTAAARVKIGLSAFTAIATFGLLTAGIMEIIRRWHASNCIKHRDEVERLLAIARSVDGVALSPAPAVIMTGMAPGELLFNVRAGLRLPDNRTEFTVIARNLFDEQYIIDAGNTGGAFGIPTFIAGAPQFVTVQLSRRF